MANMCRRTLDVDGRCKSFGIYEEDSYHATMSCTKPRALPQEMRKFWSIPHESVFVYTGTDWLPILLVKCSKEQRSLVLMILWCSWHLRCNVIHDKGTESITNSRNFLLNYMNCLQGYLGYLKPDEQYWNQLAKGAVCMTVDAVFSEETGEATTCVAIRNHLGTVILAASLPTTSFDDDEEAEIKALRLGMLIAKENNLHPSLILSDCLAAVSKVNKTTREQSRLWSIYEEVKLLKALFPNCILQKIMRAHNTLAHELAQLAKRNGAANTGYHPCQLLLPA